MQFIPYTYITKYNLYRISDSPQLMITTIIELNRNFNNMKYKYIGAALY